MVMGYRAFLPVRPFLSRILRVAGRRAANIKREERK